MKRKFDGQVMLIFLMLYSVVRFVIEFFRADTPLHFTGLIDGFPGLRMGQIIAMVTLIGAGILTAYLSRRVDFSDEPPLSPPVDSSS